MTAAAALGSLSTWKVFPTKACRAELLHIQPCVSSASPALIEEHEMRKRRERGLTTPCPKTELWHSAAIQKKRRKTLRASFEDVFLCQYLREAFRSNASRTRFLLHAPSHRLSPQSLRRQLPAAHRRFRHVLQVLRIKQKRKRE